MFREKTFKFLCKSTLFLFLIGFNAIVVGQKVDTINKINYEELIDQFIHGKTEEDYNRYNAIYSKLNIEQLKEFNKVALKRSMEEQLHQRSIDPGFMLSREQIINGVYNAGLLYEFMLKYSMEEYQRPYNQLSMSETMKLAEKVEKDSVYRSRKRDVCGVKTKDNQ